MALAGWVFSTSLGVNESTVAICVMALMLILKLLPGMMSLKIKVAGTHTNLVRGIIGLSSLLSKVGFFLWLAELLKNNISFGSHSTLAFVVIVALSILVRYFFASGSAYIVAMVPVFAMLANVSGAPVMLTALALLFSNSYGGMVTHYGGAAGPVIFGVGYNDIKSWWIVGGILALLTFILHITVGVWWWELLMYWKVI